MDEDRACIYGSHTSEEFMKCAIEFLRRASPHVRDNKQEKMFFPCPDRKNKVFWEETKTMENHLICITHLDKTR